MKYVWLVCAQVAEQKYLFHTFKKEEEICTKIFFMQTTEIFLCVFVAKKKCEWKMSEKIKRKFLINHKLSMMDLIRRIISLGVIVQLLGNIGE